MRIAFPLLLAILLLTGPVARAQMDLPKGVSPTVLLVTDESLAEAWQPFADFKTKIGLATKIIAVQAIDEAYEGQDIQAKIRSCVLDHIEQQETRYIILGGDSGPNGTGLVPDRDTPHFPMPGFGYRDIPTDLYYLSPGDKDWDANDDGVYGKWEDDMDAVAYTHPSGASLGRIPVRTADDVAAYTDKVIAYETRYPTDGFASKMIYTNTVDHSEPKVRKSWDTHLSKVWDGGEAYRFFHTETSWDGDQKGDFSLKTDNWVDRINQKMAGKMHMHGHGMPGFWVLEDDGGHTQCDAGVVEQLTNEDAYLVMTTVSCFTGMYDAQGDPTITETMLRTPKKGAVAIVCPSREGVPIFHNPQVDFRLMVTEGKLDGTTESMTRFWMNGLSPDEHGRYRTLGEAFVAMKQQMTDHAKKTSGYHWCQAELNLLGDPTLGFRATAPKNVDITLETSIVQNWLGHTGLRIKIQTGLKDQPGTRVCVWQPDGDYVTKSLDEEGQTEVMISLKGNEDFLVTVAGPSVNAATETINAAEMRDLLP